MHVSQLRLPTIALALILPFLAAAGKTFAAEESSRPNVILFFADDQGTLDVNCYGAKDLHTPTADALAARGVRFTQAYAHTVCCPSRALLLTGRHPQRGGVDGWTQGNAKAAPGLNTPLEEVTLAEALKAAGYRTGAFGKWHLGAKHTPVMQGFDESYGHLGGFIENYTHCFLHGTGFHDLYQGKDGATKEVFEKGTFFPDIVVRESLRFLEESKAEPFFLYVAFNTPHYPEQSDGKFDARYKDMPMPRRSYATVVSMTDDRMGQILAKLDELGLHDNTIVLFMSDNGASAEDSHIRVENHVSGLPKGWHYGAFGGGGYTGKWRGNKGTFFEGGIRVPAILSFPKKLPMGIVRDQAITAADIFPTVLELCSVELPRVKLDGASLLPIIRSVETPTHHRVMHWQFGSKKWAVREGDWKLIATGGKLFLGNLADDEPEAKDYAEEKPEVVERLLRYHNEWVEEVTPR